MGGIYGGRVVGGGSQLVVSCRQVLCDRLRNTFNLSESWIQELRDEGKIKILHMNSQNNPADLFTKLHSMSRFKYLLKCINCITYKNDE